MSDTYMPFTPSKRKQMQMLRDQGLKHKEIAEKFGCSRQYVAMVCGKCDPYHHVYIGEECVYPNLRKWMNENKVSRKEFVRRMGYSPGGRNLESFRLCIRGDAQPRKPYIDKMLEVTGMTYETMFCTEVEDG